MSEVEFTYLASPYSHPTKKGMHERYLEAVHATAWLLKQRIWVYSPIVHCHEVARLHDLPTDFAFWVEYSHAIIDQLSSIIILQIEGHLESKGVQDELNYGTKTGKKIHLLFPPKIPGTSEYELIRDINHPT